MALADVVLDCFCDNFATRHAVNRARVTQRKPAGVGRRDTLRRPVAVFDPRQGRRALLPLPVSGKRDVEEVPLRSDGFFRPLTGSAPSAAEALKLLIGCGTSLAGRLLLLDGLGRWREITSRATRPAKSAAPTPDQITRRWRRRPRCMAGAAPKAQDEPEQPTRPGSQATISATRPACPGVPDALGWQLGRFAPRVERDDADP